MPAPPPGTASSLPLSLDLLQLVVLRLRLGPLAPRPAEMLRLLHGRAAAGALERSVSIITRPALSSSTFGSIFGCGGSARTGARRGRLRRHGLRMLGSRLPCSAGARLLGLRAGGGKRFLRMRLFPARQRFAALVFAQLLLLHQEGGRGAGRTAASAGWPGRSSRPPRLRSRPPRLRRPAALLLFALRGLRAARVRRGGRWCCCCCGARLLLLGGCGGWPCCCGCCGCCCCGWPCCCGGARRTLLVVPAAIAAITAAAISAFAALLLAVAALLEPRLLLAIALLCRVRRRAAVAPPSRPRSRRPSRPSRRR